MSDFTDDLDLYDPPGDEDGWLEDEDYLPAGMQLDKTCRDCGKHGLRWSFSRTAGWVLAEPNGKGFHICDFSGDFKPVTPRR